MHLNINSLLPKIDYLRHMARLSNAAVIGIYELKLGKSITNSEILIDSYDLFVVTLRMTRIETEVALPTILETT